MVSVDVNMELRAPVIIIPENIFLPHRPCLALDIGVVSISSTIIQFDPSKDYKMIKAAEQVYDQYLVNLNKLEVKLLDQGLPGGTSSYSQAQGFSIIKDFTTSIIFYHCLSPFHPDYPTAELVMQLDNIDLDFNLLVA